MPKHPSEDSSNDSQKRIDAFLDCTAYLLAKRWLRDQRQQDNPPQDKCKSDSTEAG